MKPIDIFITAYSRSQFTRKTLEYLYERTLYPFRVFLIDNGGNWDAGAHFHGKDNFMHIEMHKNVGIHAAWNVALALAESEYFITSDNDIYVPDWRVQNVNFQETNTMKGVENEDWLTKLVRYMDQRPDYGAISLHPHVLIGAAGFDPSDPEDVKEVNMCGAVMRIMRTEATRKAGGWEHFINAKRNHEERTICSRLQAAGYKTGRTTRLRAYHPFGKETGGNWGYPENITPEMQGHNPELKDYVLAFDNPDAYDQKTWLPK